MREREGTRGAREVVGKLGEKRVSDWNDEMQMRNANGRPQVEKVGENMGPATVVAIYRSQERATDLQNRAEDTCRIELRFAERTDG